MDHQGLFHRENLGLKDVASLVLIRMNVSPIFLRCQDILFLGDFLPVLIQVLVLVRHRHVAADFVIDVRVADQVNMRFRGLIGIHGWTWSGLVESAIPHLHKELLDVYGRTL